MAARFIECDNVDEMSDFLSSLPNPSSSLFLGGGSNILFVSGRCETVIRPVFKGIELTGETDDHVSVSVGAGEIWDDFVAWSVEKGFSGAENLSNIPGTVGACPIQNIGAYGVEAKDIIESVEAVEIETGNRICFNNEQCLFDYRDSFFKKNKGKYIITAVRFRLAKKFIPNIKYTDLKIELARALSITPDSVRRAIISIRGRKLPDPAKTGNAGSFFKNPTINAEKSAEISQYDSQAPVYPITSECWKISAAWLIQQCGLKGLKTGRVGTYPKQPLVIVNYGGATGREVIDFAEKIIDAVDKKFGIRPEAEVNIV